MRVGWTLLVIALAAAALGVVVAAWHLRGPSSLRAEWEADVMRVLARGGHPPLVTEADLAPLPPPVQRYLRGAGVVGQPRVGAYRVRFTGRIRGGPDKPWMPFSAWQVSSTDGPARLFYMEARMFGVPVAGYHRYLDGAASMRVKVLGLVGVVDAGGADFTATETVTVLNDMSLLAPAALLDPAIRWRPLDDHSVEATLTAAGHAVRATLHFDERDQLIDFRSDDRPALSSDGKRFDRQRWSTPLRDYRAFGPLRLASYGEARYAAPAGDYAYGEFHIEEVVMNPER